jgi:hypothetical protein
MVDHVRSTFANKDAYEGGWGNGKIHVDGK